MVNVLLTIDTEFWPRTPNWLETNLEAEIGHDIYGLTGRGDYGLPFQLEMLKAYGLKAVFFLEALSPCAVGLGPLRKVARLILDAGQEIQLHAHSEWLGKAPQSILPGRKGKYLRHFSEDEQSALIAEGIRNLKACGVQHLTAFRAGNYGANRDTLRAVFRNGLLYDSSYNPCYLDSPCTIAPDELLFQPRQIEGVLEFPVSVFSDFPGHYRHAQLTACSAPELERALVTAFEAGWFSFVLVSHSFELIRRPKKPGGLAQPNRVVIKRFESLCRFLAKNRDRFPTVGFAGIVPGATGALDMPRPLKSSLYQSARRVVEQIVGRFE